VDKFNDSGVPLLVDLYRWATGFGCTGAKGHDENYYLSIYQIDKLSVLWVPGLGFPDSRQTSSFSITFCLTYSFKN